MRLEGRRVAKFVLGAALGVDHLHRVGMVHGDLSLKNVLLDHEEPAPSGGCREAS